MHGLACNLAVQQEYFTKLHTWITLFEILMQVIAILLEPQNHHIASMTPNNFLDKTHVWINKNFKCRIVKNFLPISFEAVLLSTHNICFGSEIRKFIFFYTHLGLAQSNLKFVVRRFLKYRFWQCLPSLMSEKR